MISNYWYFFGGKLLKKRPIKNPISILHIGIFVISCSSFPPLLLRVVETISCITTTKNKIWFFKISSFQSQKLNHSVNHFYLGDPLKLGTKSEIHSWTYFSHDSHKKYHLIKSNFLTKIGRYVFTFFSNFISQWPISESCWLNS